MKKQILFPKFTTRVFCTVLDILLLYMVLMFIEPFLKHTAINLSLDKEVLNRHPYLLDPIATNEMLVRHNINIFDKNSINQALINNNVDPKDFQAVEKFFASSVGLTKDELENLLESLLKGAAFMWLTEILIMILYITTFTYKFNATPAKMIMRLKIVSRDTFEAPTLKQSIVRTIFATLAPIGLWFIPFTKNKQALHDLVSGTVIIKS